MTWPGRGARWGLVWAWCYAACSVEPPKLDPDAGVEDSGGGAEDSAGEDVAPDALSDAGAGVPVDRACGQDLPAGVRVLACTDDYTQSTVTTSQSASWYTAQGELWRVRHGDSERLRLGHGGTTRLSRLVGSETALFGFSEIDASILAWSAAQGFEPSFVSGVAGPYGLFARGDSILWSTDAPPAIWERSLSLGPGQGGSLIGKGSSNVRSLAAAGEDLVWVSTSTTELSVWRARGGAPDGEVLTSTAPINWSHALAVLPGRAFVAINRCTGCGIVAIGCCQAWIVSIDLASGAANVVLREGPDPITGLALSDRHLAYTTRLLVMVASTSTTALMPAAIAGTYGSPQDVTVVGRQLSWFDPRRSGDVGRRRGRILATTLEGQ